MGSKLFVTSTWQLFQYWRVVLRLSLFWIVVRASVYWIEAAIYRQLAATGEGGYWPLEWVTYFVSGSIILVSTISVAIGWHRYILLDEMPPKLFIINLNWPIARYFWMMVQVAIVLLLIHAPYGYFVAPAVVSFLADLNLGEGFFGLSGMLRLVDGLVSIFIYWVILRLALTLPAAAIGGELQLYEALQLTRLVKFQLLVTAVLITAFDMIGRILLVTTTLAPYSPLLDNLWLIEAVGMLIGWLGFLIGVSVLTNAFILLYQAPLDDTNPS